MSQSSTPALVQLSGCADGSTCPGVWLDPASGDLVVIGGQAPEHAGLAGPGEVGNRISPALVAEALANLP